MTQRASPREILDLCEQALDRSAHDREAFLSQACGSDAGLRRAVDSMLLAISDSAEFLEASEAAGSSAPQVGQRIGVYELLREIGSGGMGQVFLAKRLDDQFEQQVAIKLVHGNLLARELIERFNAERQILAALNHPYIAGLIDGGTTDSGIPYLVMEFVDGQPIDQYCDEHALSLEARIKLLQKIALAVQAAHQNLVVHRDLKPGNVLVTQDGIPKLLDFGIAKLIVTDASQHSHTTVFGRQPLTPDYASPEQLLENRVTTVSDVYSLGVLAFELLVGERPYTLAGGSHTELAKAFGKLNVPSAIERLDAIKDSQRVKAIAAARGLSVERLRRRLAGDLDVVLTKAIHRDESRRYESVAMFAEDLGRFIEGQPVAARPDSTAYRIQHFVRRNRLAVGASVAVLAALVVGLTTTTWAYLQAEKSRVLASQRFDDVRGLATAMMFDVFEEVEQVPGTKSALQKLAQTTQAYLERLANDESAELDVRLDAARGFARLARLLSDPALADPEQRVRAQAARVSATDLLSQLKAANPDSIQVWRTVARFRRDNAVEELESNNDPAAARAEVEQSLTASSNALQLDPDDVESHSLRLSAEVRLADTYKWETEYSRARDLADAAIERANRLAESYDGDEGIMLAVADTWRFSGELSWFLDEFEVGVDHYQSAIDIYEEIAASYPTQSNPVLIETSDTIWSQANSLFDLGRLDEAIERYRRAEALTAVRVARDPDDRDAERTLNILKGSRAAALSRQDRGAEGTALILEVTNWFEQQAARDPQSPSAQRSLAVSYHMTADVHRDAGDQPSACRWYRQTLNQWQKIDETLGIAEFDATQPEYLNEILSESC